MWSISSRIRRNRPGDRAKALELIEPIVNSGGKVASDIYCLCGRIYKDMFMSSGFTDQSSRDQACYWYSRSLSGREQRAWIDAAHMSSQLMLSRCSDAPCACCYLSGTGRRLRRSRRSTQASTTWSSWWQLATNLTLPLSCAKSVLKVSDSFGLVCHKVYAASVYHAGKRERSHYFLVLFKMSKFWFMIYWFIS